jgi:hypothetical protein
MYTSGFLGGKNKLLGKVQKFRVEIGHQMVKCSEFERATSI